MADIYAIGDGAYLTEVINSLALLTSSSSFTGLTMVGFTIGVLWTGIESVMNGGKEFKIQNILIAALVWMAMFGTTTEVIIQDVKTSKTRVVSNVPFGIAMTGQIVSSIGYHLTERFEQAFSTTSMLEYGYAKKFSVIRALDTLDDLGKADSDTSGIGSRTRTMENYLAKCTLKGIDDGSLSAKTIAESGDLLEAIKLNNPALFVGVFIPGLPQPATGFPLSCAAAHDAIKADLLGGTFQSQLMEHLKTVLDNPDPEDLLEKIYEEDLIFGAVGTPVLNIVVNAFIKNRFGEAIVQKAANESAKNHYSVMINQATNQRNDQWMAQHDMFTKTAPILMTFFESLMYAIAPFLAFILALGPAGFSFAAQYLKMALWIQLWSPVMAIIYFFTNFAFQGKMDSLVNSSQIDPFSIQGQAYVAASAADWLATGAMLVAATPFITLMLIYGGAQAATTLTRQIQGQDHINEKITSRDQLATTPRVTDIGNATTLNNGALGHGSPGSNSVQPKIGTSLMRSNMTASSNARQVAAQTSAVNSVTSGTGIDYNEAYAISSTHSWGGGTTGTTSKSDSVINKAAKNISDSVGQSSEVSSQFQTRMQGTVMLSGGGSGANQENLAKAMGQESASNIATKYGITDPGMKSQLADIMTTGHKDQASGNKGGIMKAMGKVGNLLSAKGIPLSASGSASLASIGSNAEKMNVATTSAFNREVGASSTFGRELKESVKDDLMNSDGKTNSSVYKTANSEGWTKASTGLAASTKTFQNTSARNSALSMKQEMDSQQFASQLISNNADQGIRDFVSSTPGLSGRMNNETKRLKTSAAYKGLDTSQGSEGHRQLSTQAASTVLARAIDEDFFKKEGNQERMAPALAVMSGSMAVAMGTNTHGFNPDAYAANAGLQTPNISKAAETKQAVKENTQSHGGFALIQPAENFQSAYDDAKSPATQSDAQAGPKQIYDNNKGELQDRASSGFAAIDANAANEISPKIPENTALHNASKYTMGLVGDTGGVIEGFANNFKYGMSDEGKTEAVRSRGMDAYSDYKAAGLSDNYAAAATFISTGHLMEQHQPEGYEPTYASTPMLFANALINTNFANESDEAITKDLLGIGSLQQGVSKDATENHYEQFRAAVRTDDTTRLAGLSRLSPETNQEQQQDFRDVIGR